MEPGIIKSAVEIQLGQSNGTPEPAWPPVTIWSFGYNAEETLTVYGALGVYLKILCQQPEDPGMIARVARLMGEMKPAAVKASQELEKREK